MLGAKHEEMNDATLLAGHGSDKNLQDRYGETALFLDINQSVYLVNGVLKYLV